jgi:heat shock protein HslJ
MTDDQMDARLRRAGDAWRAANPGSDAIEPDVEPVELAQPAQRRRMPRPGLLLSAAAVAAALVAGAAVVLTNVGGNGHRSADVSGLAGTVWQLEGRGGVASTATVVFNADGTFVADDTCEVFGGSYDVDHGMLFAEPHDLRDKQCTDASGDVTFGDNGLIVLTSGTAYTLDGGALTIGSGSDALHLRAAPELPRPTFDVPTAEGATWVLTGVRGSDDVDHTVQGTPTFVIKNHQLHASDSCNTLSGEADVVGNTLTTTKGGGLQMTEIGCDQQVMATASVVDAVFSGDSTLAIAGATLTITRNGAGTLTYAWQPDEAQATNPATLESRSWRLTAFAGKSTPPGVTLDIASDQTYRLHDGCRQIAGTAEVGPGTLSLRGFGASNQTCDLTSSGELTTTVDSFFGQQPALWRIEDGKLLVFGGGAQAYALVFTPDQPVVQLTTPPTIEGKSWSLTQLSTEGSNSGSGTATSASGVALTVTATTFTLNTSCHNYSGTAHHTADTIEFADVRDLGGPACHDTFADAAAHLVQSGSATWLITRGELEIVQGKTTLTFDR